MNATPRAARPSQKAFGSDPPGLVRLRDIGLFGVLFVQLGACVWGVKVSDRPAWIRHS